MMPLYQSTQVLMHSNGSILYILCIICLVTALWGIRTHHVARAACCVTSAQVDVPLQMKLEDICEALDSLEDGSCRVELESKVKQQLVQCLMPGACKIILVTGPQDAGTLHSQASLLKCFWCFQVHVVYISSSLLHMCSVGIC